MVRKEVKPLNELCAKMVSEKLYNYAQKHCSTISCKVCSSFVTNRCHEVKTTKDTLAMLPGSVRQNILDLLLPRLAVTPETKIRFPEFHMNVTYFIYELLHFSNLCILNCSYLHIKCHNFIVRFGENIQGIKFSSFLPAYAKMRIELGFWKGMFENLQNVQVLDVHSVILTSEHFEVIGRECTQLKVLRGLEFFWGNVPIPIKDFSTAVERLFIQNDSDNLNTSLCKTLHTVTFAVSEQFYYVDINILLNDAMNDIVLVLCKYLPNLREIGGLKSDAFLHSINAKGIVPITNLEVIHISTFTKELIPLLKIFCCKLKKLVIDETEINCGIEQLGFPFLEHLQVRKLLQLEVLVNWGINPGELRNLRYLQIDSETDLNLGILALELCQLQYLQCNRVNKFIWESEVFFENLREINFISHFDEILFFRSFAATIERITLKTTGPCLNRANCQVLLDIPFLQLEYLLIQNFENDVNFLTTLISRCPKLRTCDLFPQNLLLKKGQILEARSFMKANNFECNLGVVFPESAFIG